jgi:hypothetical protein
MNNIYTPHSIKLQSNSLVHGRAVLPRRPEIIWAAQQRSLTLPRHRQTHDIAPFADADMRCRRETKEVRS